MSDIRDFDPSETVRGIQQLLVSDKKKIAFLFGAGTSFARRNEDAPYIPAVKEMTEMIEEKKKKKEIYKTAIAEIKAEFSADFIEFNIENILSNIEDKIRIIGNGKLNNLNKNDLEGLAKFIREEIREIVSVHKKFKENNVQFLVQYDFAKWVKNADRKYAIEIFTTNYDYLFEIGLEEVGVPYYDGFTGGYMPFFNPSSLEGMDYLPQQTKLWKIHGSLGLHEIVTSKTHKIIRKSSDSEDLLIYPSTLKYSNSKKMPYVAFIDRLNDFLKQDDAVLFVCGYSFGDEHINERILSALNTNSTSHVFVFYYDIVRDKEGKKYLLTKDSKLAQIALNNKRISVLGARNAIIGFTYGKWKLKREPDKSDTLNVQWYFDEDAPINTDAKITVEQKENEEWTGEGELVLPDFNRFVGFLKNMIPKNEWEESDIGKVSN
jgi:hypothetical protein